MKTKSLFKSLAFVFLSGIYAGETSYAQETNFIACDNASICNAYTLAVNTCNDNIANGILKAGAEYNGGWVRDIAINVWNGFDFYNAAVAKQSLWSVTNSQNNIGAEYWDHIIWVLGAYDYYKATGDIDFLRQAYTCSVNTMNDLENTQFDSQYGMFKGPSVFNDGIAGYPEPIYNPSISSGYVLDHPNSKSAKCLSTNCVYYGAYMALVEMGKLLNISNSYQGKANNLKANILKYLYSASENKLYYLIDNNGAVAKYQEGLGISFAIMFNVLSKDQAYRVILGATTSQFGITSIYPDFPRYSSSMPGRHNNIIWPMVNGFFAKAATSAGARSAFNKELNGLTQLALDQNKGNNQFWEVYNPYSGIPDGGWQSGWHWNSCKKQTWSATAYMNMITDGICGMRMDNTGITFAPYLPSNITYIKLKGLKYRAATIDVIVRGAGSTIKSFLINGQAQTNYWIDQSIKGNNTIEIVVGNVDSALPSFYQDCNFGGYAVNLGVGDYNLSALTAKGILNDDISSLKIPSGFKAILYLDDNFGGNSITLTGNDDCLTDNGWNDAITSIKIRPNGVGGLNGTYSLQNRNSGIFMDVAGTSAADGANILQWTGNGATNQQFKLTDVGDGAYSIIGVQSGKAVDVSRADPNNLADVYQWTYVGGNNQKFIFIATDNGYYKLKAVHSGRIVEVAGGSTAAGADIIQYDDNNQAHGQWKLAAPGSLKSANTSSAPTANAEEIAIYPNPTADIVTITGVPANTKIMVLNIYGQILMNMVVSGENKINVSDLKAGTYFVKIGNEKTLKLLKK